MTLECIKKLKADVAILKAECEQLRKENVRMAASYHLSRNESIQFKAELRRLLLDVLDDR